MKSVLFGIAASFFFALTFVLNRSMALSGGSWVWSAALRYFFMLPLLAVLLAPGGGLGRPIRELRENPLPWIVWSFVGFGLFYAPLCFAAAYGPSWLVAATWQVTIVAGAFLSPLFREKVSQGKSGRARSGARHRVPLRVLVFSAAILAGVVLLQIREPTGSPAGSRPIFALVVLIAAFSYPLGNRKTMELAAGRLSAMQRVFAMTLASLPFWVLLAAGGLGFAGPPEPSQYLQTFVVALGSGVIATVLFFRATDRVRSDMRRLAAVESTQAGEVLFALLGGSFLFGDPLPDAIGLAGIALVIIGMILNGFLNAL